MFVCVAYGLGYVFVVFLIWVCTFVVRVVRVLCWFCKVFDMCCVWFVYGFDMCL